LGLSPCNPNLSIEGASSDHLILDVTEVTDIKLGDKLEFTMNYSCLLKAMTSTYVDLEYVQNA
jgi:predicted amino acid racemase